MQFLGTVSGRYVVGVTLANEDIRGSPFTVDVLPGSRISALLPCHSRRPGIRADSEILLFKHCVSARILMFGASRVAFIVCVDVMTDCVSVSF